MLFEVDDKIININGEKLEGKSYFEILELVLSKKDDEIKTFTFSNGKVIEYAYKNYSNKLEYNADTNTLSVYNLDEIKIKNALSLIKKLSKDYQIIYFICHSSRCSYEV